MFIEATAPVTLSASQTREALLAALGSGDVLRASGAAYDDGVIAIQNVGPRGISKRVLVRTLGPTDVGDLRVFPIRWEATGLFGHLFPTLEASLAICPVNDVTAILSVIGRYVVPFGRIGEALDHAALAAVAQRTLDLFVRDVAHCVESCAHADKISRVAAS